MVDAEILYECAIIGSGPAAYAAVMKLKSYKTILFEGSYKGSMVPGGQLMTTTDVDNFPGFPNGITGPELIKTLERQVSTNVIPKFVLSIEKINQEKEIDIENKEKSMFKINTDKEFYYAKTIIIATGALARRIYVPGTHDNEFWQKGISSCAVCDGWAFKDKTVVVIGGGDTAMEEAKHMSGIAKTVILVHRQEKFKARHDMLQNVKNKGNVKIMYPFKLHSVEGTNRVEKAIFENSETGEITTLKVEGIFFGIGHDPNSDFLGDIISKDKEGYIITEDNGKTSCEGIFACGDVQDKKYKQAITAARSGCLSAIGAIEYLKNNKTILK